MTKCIPNSTLLENFHDHFVERNYIYSMFDSISSETCECPVHVVSVNLGAKKSLVPFITQQMMELFDWNIKNLRKKEKAMSMQMLIYNLRKMAKGANSSVEKDILKNAAYFMVFCKDLIKMTDLAVYEKDAALEPCSEDTDKEKCWAVNENILEMMREFLDNLVSLGYITEDERHPRK
jgi:hypothetical protein